MKIGLDQFSFHRFHGDVFPWESDPVTRWTLVDFLEYANQQRVQLVGLHVHYLTTDEATHLGETLASRGMTAILEWGHPDGLQMGTNREAVGDLQRWLARAGKIGVPLVRIVAGYPSWRGREPVATQIERLVPILRDLCHEAAALNITLAIENHADFTPKELLDLVKRVGSKHLRICFDTGNCVRVGADLVESARAVAPFTAMVHLKDLRVLEASQGDPSANWPSAPIGQGSFDLPAVLDALSSGGFDGPLLIELAQLHPDFHDEQTVVEQSLRWLRNHVAPETARK